MLYILLYISLSFLNPNGACNPEDKVFPCPISIEKKVNFWLKIYTQIPNNKGLLHDPDSYEIYKTIDISNYNGRAKKRFINTEKKNISQNLGIRKKEIRFQQGQKDNFIAGLKRSYRYLRYIKKIFTSVGLPEDLSYLPHVESSFNYKAYSKMGASGIWQFTNSTGKRYMKIDYAIDERNDPIVATVAAAKFLKNNYEKLGSWPITITSYNHGLSGMMRAVKKNGDDFTNIIKNHRSRSFGFASKNFYSEFLAARYIAKNEKEFFGDLIPHNEYEYLEIKLSSYIDINSIVKNSDYCISKISEYNPALRNSVLQSKRYIPKGYGFRVPKEDFEKLYNIISNLPKNELFATQKRPQWYRVRYGDNLSTISKKLGVSMNSLIAYNNLDSTYIHAGEVLEIPKLGYKPKKTETKISNKNKTVKEVKIATNNYTKEEVKDEDIKIEELYGPPSPVTATNNFPTLNSEDLLVYKYNNNKGYIRVQPEETLSHLSDWLITYKKTIKNWNHLRYNTVYINQRLKLYFNKVSKEEFEQKRIEFHKSLFEDFFDNYKVINTQDYKLRRGDSIWALSKEKFNIPIWLIYMYNPELDYKNLSYGQIIKIPVVESK